MIQIKALTPELQKIAIEELFEVPARLTEDLLAFKEWIRQQSHLKLYDDDQYLLQYIRGAKHSMEQAKEKLDFWFSIPKRYLVEDVNNPKYQHLATKGLIVPLPRPLNDTGPRILMIRVDFDPQEYTPEELIRGFLAWHYMLMVTDPYACIQGIVYIVDLGAITTNHLLMFNINLLKKVILPMLKAAIFRIKAAYFLNLPNYAESLSKLALSFVTGKMRNRIFVYKQNSEATLDKVPQKYLPLEYGGENGSLDQLAKEHAALFLEHGEPLKRIFDCRSDESLRQGKCPFDYDELLGVTGSFRKLDVD